MEHVASGTCSISYTKFDMAINKKKTNESTSTSASKKQVIQVNPYENPENVLDLMAKICSATPSASKEIFNNQMVESLSTDRGVFLNEYFSQNRSRLYNYDFQHDLEECLDNVVINLACHENTDHAQIVIAGGFSSGKSSFLNRLTKCTNLLPTGVEPVSVVKTYLYCSRNNKGISVKGVNQKNVLVNLNVGVLSAIQHAKKSNIYLASVLDKLFVNIPSQDLDGIVFIDTPGYNNTDKPNEPNGKTDRDTALEALGEGNVLFWLVDCERGTTVSDDLEMIKQFGGKKVIIFNKADKKGQEECKRIVEEAARALYKEISQEEIIDIIAYSTLDNKIYYSKNKKNLSQIVKEAKKSGNGNTEMEVWIELIEELFDTEISDCRKALESIKNEYKEAVKEKSEKETMYRDIKYNDDDYITSEVRNVLVNSYNEVLSAARDITAASLNTLDKFEDFLNEINYWDNNDHVCWENNLRPKIDRAASQYNRCVENHNSAIDYSFYKEEYRKDLSDRIRNYIADRVKELYDSACQHCEYLLENKNDAEIMEKNFLEYKNLFMNALELAIRAYQKADKAANVQSEVATQPNVFDCIRQDDYKRFLNCFEDGVDMSVCNSEGFSPLTLAVQSGNNTMVKFLLDHEADPSMLDKRGYNAFHTAVENQFRDICQILLDNDPELIDSKTASGETVGEISKKDTFARWIEKEINNAL